MATIPKPAIGTLFRAIKTWTSVRGHEIMRGDIGWVCEPDTPLDTLVDPNGFEILWLVSGKKSRFGNHRTGGDDVSSFITCVENDDDANV